MKFAFIVTCSVFLDSEWITDNVILRLEYKRAGEFAPFSALFQIELIALHDLKIETRHTDLCCHENDHSIAT